MYCMRRTLVPRQFSCVPNSQCNNGRAQLHTPCDMNSPTVLEVVNIYTTRVKYFSVEVNHDCRWISNFPTRTEKLSHFRLHRSVPVYMPLRTAAFPDISIAIRFQRLISKQTTKQT
jgi:hypothetical protein